MLPGQCAQFEDSQAGSVKEPEKGSIAPARLKSQNLVDDAFSENALREAVSVRRQTERPSNVEGEIANAMTKGQERLHARQDATPARRRKPVQRVREVLEVRKRDGLQGLTDERAEARYVTPVRSLRVGTTAVQPQLQQLLVAAGPLIRLQHRKCSRVWPHLV